MANWCENKVIIGGSSESDIGRLKELICGENGTLDFHKIVPLGDVSGLDGRERYERVTGLWGVKCSVGDVKLYRNLWHSENSMEFEFDTPWGPPFGIVDKIRELIDENKLDVHMEWTYYEPGMQLCGCL